jgi:Fe-S-cluster containining protein
MMAEDEWITGNIGANVRGIPMEFELTVPAKPVKPQRMLPIFQQMANTMVDITVEGVKSEGESISCKAGCGACCRQAVPIAEAEVYMIADLVESMPEPRRSVIKKRFADATDRLHKNGWFDRMIDLRMTAADKGEQEAMKEWLEIVLSYFHEQIPCPFLEDESCSIHPSRPVSCREYLVVSPAENCSDLSPVKVRTVSHLIQPSKSVNKLGATGQMDNIGFPVLIRALELAERFPENFAEKTGPEWMKDFFAELSQGEIPDGTEKQLI